MASKNIIRLALVAALGGAAATVAYAQHQHGGHGGGHAGHQGAGAQQGTGDLERMRGMMRQMMGTMDRMQKASPAERERMMNEMRPMMQSMHGMMGHGPGDAQAGRAAASGHQNHGQPATGAAAKGSTKAYEEANAKMHRDMAISFSGNPDVDFVRGMIPHHQGAIDMANVALRFGKDEWVRKLAQEVIVAQTREIAEMRDWLGKNGR